MPPERRRAIPSRVKRASVGWRGYPGWLVLIGVACSSPDRPERWNDDPKGVPVERVPERSSAFRPGRCPVAPPAGHTADCGTVRVSEAEAGSREVELAVMVLYSKAEVPPDPVVYLEGGPGSSAIAITQYEPFVFDPILEQRDLILIDQRGTGFSNPALFCTGGLGVDIAEELELTADCRSEWQERGVDLGQYNTRQNARDVEQVREALGYELWNVYGISYGSRLGLTVVRDYPEHVRSLIIDGVLPLQVDLLAEGVPSLAGSLESLNQACQEQASCAEAYGNLVTRLFESVDRLDRAPVELELAGGQSLPLTGSLAFNVIAQLLYVAEVLPYMPALIAQIYEEDYVLFELLADSFGGESGLAVGMYYSVTCQDEAAFTTRDTIENARAGLDPHYVMGFDATLLMDVCEIWDVPASPASENLAVESEIPSLVLSGAFDPVTPPGFGALAAAGLSNSQEFVLPDQAHGASVSQCGMSLVSSFLDAPTEPLTDRCLGRLGPPGFVTGRWSEAELPVPTLQFEVPVRWDEGLVDRLKRALERSARHWPGAGVRRVR